jgi:ubiquitin C
MLIFVRSPTGRIVSLRVQPSDTISAIKAKMLEQHHLVLDGVQLDDNRTLTDYDIQHQSTLDLQENMQIYVMDTLAGTNTTGEAKFPECHMLPRVPKIGHSGKTNFPECCTRGRNALGEDGLPRVPGRAKHSGKNGTRGRPSSPRATLGEERHTKKKSCI